MNRDYFWLTDAQFAKLEPHLPNDTRGKPRVDDRRVISGYRARHQERRTLGRCARGLRSEEDALQPLPALGGQGRVERHLPCAGQRRKVAGADTHRFLRRSCASLRRRR